MSCEQVKKEFFLSYAYRHILIVRVLTMSSNQQQTTKLSVCIRFIMMIKRIKYEFLYII
jgi:hypothetical protein